jgi:hypothetical protein
MQKMIFWIGIFVLVVFAWEAMAIRKPGPEPAPGAAESTTPAKSTIGKTEKFTGEIDKVDEKGKTIAVKGKVMKDEKILTFAVDGKTRITKGETTMAFGLLKKKMEVSVDYKRAMGKLIAIAIEVSSSKEAPK